MFRPRAMRELNETLDRELFRSIIARYVRVGREAGLAEFSSVEEFERALRGGAN
jgi:hypothetical protein